MRKKKKNAALAGGMIEPYDSQTFCHIFDLKFYDVDDSNNSKHNNDSNNGFNDKKFDLKKLDEDFEKLIMLRMTAMTKN